MLNSLFLFMAPPPGAGGDAGGGLMSTLIMFGSIIAIFYFMILRPQQKKQKAMQHLIESLKKGDKVVMSGGLHGTVSGIDEKTVLVQVADNVKMKFEKAAVTTVVREGEAVEKKESK
jgi:preprotein translocase subunit YajC